MYKYENNPVKMQTQPVRPPVMKLYFVNRDSWMVEIFMTVFRYTYNKNMPYEN